MMLPTEPRTATEIFNPSFLVGSSCPRDWFLRLQRLIYMAHCSPKCVPVSCAYLVVLKLTRSQVKSQKEKALVLLLVMYHGC